MVRLKDLQLLACLLMLITHPREYITICCNVHDLILRGRLTVNHMRMFLYNTQVYLIASACSDQKNSSEYAHLTKRISLHFQ